MIKPNPEPRNGESLRGFLDGFSVETTPQAALRANHADFLPPDTQVYLTHLAKDTLEDIAAAVGKISGEGMMPVPHIAARNIRNIKSLEKYIKLLHQKYGVRKMLLIGGSAQAPAGPFEASLDVLKTGVFEQCGIQDIAFAGHPECTPDFDNQTAIKALKDKISYCEKHGLQASILTQFLFKAAPVIQWENSLREQGIYVPVKVGLAGPTRPSQLIRYARACGVGPSMRVLTRNPFNFVRYFSRPYNPGSMLESLEDYCANNPRSSLNNPPHFYALGGVPQLAAWLKSLS